MKYQIILAVILLSKAALAQDEIIRKLYDRSDLIVLGTLKGPYDGTVNSGPITNPKIAQIQPRGFAPELHVIAVYKGTPKTANDFPIGLTLCPSDKDPHPFIPESNHPYIIFLEDRLKREPNSVSMMGDEIIYFRNFDFFISLLEPDKGLILKLKALRAEQDAAANP